MIHLACAILVQVCSHFVLGSLPSPLLRIDVWLAIMRQFNNTSSNENADVKWSHQIFTRFLYN